MWELVVLIIFIILCFTCFIIYHQNNPDSKKYGIPVKVDESSCMKKPGHDISKRRCTYRCDDPRGCLYKGKIQNGIFYGTEDCDPDEKISGWTYITSGPFYGTDDRSSKRIGKKTSDAKMYEPEKCRTCLSLKTGHPILFSEGEHQLGFTGISAKCFGKCSKIDARLSSKYENNPEHLERINNLIEERKPSIITIDNQPYVLQPCYPGGNISFNHFILKNDECYVRYDNQKLTLAHKTDENRDCALFSLENVMFKDNAIMGTLICYTGIYEKGWVDSDMVWHAGLPKNGAISVTILDGCINHSDGKPLKFKQPKNGRIVNTVIRVEILDKVENFIRARRINT